MSRRDRWVLLGTDPEGHAGGISMALSACLAAFHEADEPVEMIVTHRPGSPFGKWGLWLLALPRLLRLARQGGCVYAHAGEWPSLVRKLAMLWLARRMGARTFLQLHAVQVDSYLTNPIARGLLRTMLAQSVHCIGVLTPWWEQRLRAAGIAQPITVIPNPVLPELSAIANRPREPRAVSESLSLLAMTRLLPGKGVDLAIEALQHLPDTVRLVIAGNGPERKRLEAQAHDQGVSGRVRFFGWASDGDKAQLLSEADVFCLPTTNDSFGMGFLEAMAYGLPVVALRFGAIPDVIPDERAGYLADTATPEAIAAHVLRLMDDSTRSRMGEEGKRWVNERYSSSYWIQCLRTTRGKLSAI